MKKLFAVSGVVLAAFGVFAISSTKTVTSSMSAREISPLQLEEEIPVPNVAGRIDHFTADVKRRRLIFSPPAWLTMAADA